jgi:hypothetical protein
MMWLSKNERGTLLKYYNYLQNTQEYTRFVSLSERAYTSTRNLIDRGLLHEIIEGGPEHVESLVASMAKDSINLHHFLASSEDDIECDNITLSLTLEGYDLGSKYNSWYYKTGGMWWAEYKGHWFWTIVGIVVSFLLGLLIGILT